MSSDLESNSSSPKSVKSTSGSLSFPSTVDHYALFIRTLYGTLVMHTHDSRSLGQRVAPLSESQFLGTVDYCKAVMLQYLDDRDPQSRWMGMLLVPEGWRTLDDGRQI